MVNRKDLLEEMKAKDKLIKECFRSKGFGRGSCTKGWRIEKYPQLYWDNYRVHMWEDDGNYAGGDTFDSGPKPIQFSTAYMLILGIEAYCKELQAEKPYG